MCEQDLTHTYQMLLEICKVHEQVILFYCKAQIEEPSQTDVALVTLDVLKSKAPYHVYYNHLTDTVTITNNTSKIKALTTTTAMGAAQSVILPTNHKTDALPIALHAPNTTGQTIGPFAASPIHHPQADLAQTIVSI